jgi:hypothetical protein
MISSIKRVWNSFPEIDFSEKVTGKGIGIVCMASDPY